MSQEIFIWQDSCYDVGGGGATVAVYQSLEEAIAAHPAEKSSVAMADPDVISAEWVLDGVLEPQTWCIRLTLSDSSQVWEARKSYSSNQSITKATFGQEV